MKALIFSALTLALLLCVDPPTGQCGGPFSRLIRCKSKPVCVPVGSACSTQTPDEMGTADHPSELNILMTNELVALRQQVEALQAETAEKDQAIAESTQLVARLRGEADQLKKKLARQTNRANQAEEGMAAAKEASAKAEKAARAAEAKADQQIQTLTEKNSKLQRRSANLTKKLEKATDQLEQEKQNPQKEDRKNGDKAIETPPAAVKDDEATATNADAGAGPGKE